MKIAWDQLQARHKELSQLISDGGLDRRNRHQLQKELSYLSRVLDKHASIQDLQKELSAAQQQVILETDAELKELFQEEVNDLQAKITQAEVILEDLMVPADEHDDRSVFLEIRAGAGGKEAALFVGDLLKMYTSYALRKGWKASVDTAHETDLGGYKEVVLHIKGPNAYGHLKRESGVHRVQRVPATETSGRVHTSTATVAVLPEAKDVDVTINPSDLRIDVFRASGAGGQHVNTTDSAVRITHIPTGVVVSCQEERSQHKNKAKAMKRLESQILLAQVQQEHAKRGALRKEQVGTGMRAEKVRTYNYPQNRVSDHQVNVTLKKLDMVMQGELDEIIDALLIKENDDRKMQFQAQFK